MALVLLAFLFPRLPNRSGGGLWRYFAGYTAVLLLLAEVWRHAESIRGWWAGSAQRRRTAFAMLGIGAARALSAAARRHRSTATRQDSTGGSEPV